MLRTVNVKSWKQAVSIETMHNVKSYSFSKVQFFGLDTGPQLFGYLFIALNHDNTLFEVSPKICCSGVSSRNCCYGNHAAGSMPI